MLRKISVAQLAYIKVMRKCDFVWILPPWYLIDGIMRSFMYDVSEGCHWVKYVHNPLAQIHFPRTTADTHA